MWPWLNKACRESRNYLVTQFALDFLVALVGYCDGGVQNSLAVRSTKCEVFRTLLESSKGLARFSIRPFDPDDNGRTELPSPSR